jgi:hypothetical protein
MFNDIAELIADAAHGEINEDATKELKTLVSEMQRLAPIVGKPKGKLVLTIDITLDRGTFDTQVSTRITMPAKVKPRAFLFPTKDGFLSEEDTRQGSLFGTDAAAGKNVSVGAPSGVRSISDRKMAAAGDE